MSNSIFKKVKLYYSFASTVQALLPGGKRSCNRYYPLNPIRNDKNSGSFVIDMINEKWTEFATGDRGSDITSLYAYIKGIGQYTAAKELLEKHSYYRVENPNLITPKVSKVPKAVSLQFIKKIWRESRMASNTPVETYLQSRGIKGDIPQTIRFHATLKHSETKSFYPAMISVITVWPSTVPAAIHRTYLKPDGSGKAELERNKMILGPAKGGAVRLDSHSNKLIIAEGIETALSIQLATGIPTWAALSSTNMQSIILPPPEQVPEIIIAADNDEAGIKAANILAERALKLCHKVRIAIPKQQGWDFNDVLRG